jgi:hypothetical protein
MSDQPGKGYTAKHAEKTVVQAISVTDLQNINIVGNNIIQHLLMNTSAATVVLARDHS